MKKILLIDNSALMRRVLCDIINADVRFRVVDEVGNGEAALELLMKNTYDAIVLDVNISKMNGIELLREVNRCKIKARILVTGTVTVEGAKVTMEALELGALDFIQKPDWAYKCKEDEFANEFLKLLDAVCKATIEDSTQRCFDKAEEIHHSDECSVSTKTEKGNGKKIIALACSTGGPRALQSIIPYLPENMNAPMVLVQHMPVGFTQSLANRLDTLSKVRVVEANEGDVLEDGCVYVARSGMHMNLIKKGAKTMVHYSDEPNREGVKPCANYMYESLRKSNYDEVVCVVLTGMGADGTEGISYLKEKKETYVITQNGETCVVNGMPNSVVKAGLSDKTVPLSLIAQEIILRVGVK